MRNKRTSKRKQDGFNRKRMRKRARKKVNNEY